MTPQRESLRVLHHAANLITAQSVRSSNDLVVFAIIARKDECINLPGLRVSRPSLVARAALLILWAEADAMPMLESVLQRPTRWKLRLLQSLW